MAGVTRIGPMLEGFLKRAGLIHKLKAELALQAWAEVAGSSLAPRTEAFSVRNGILFVGCASPALAHHLSFMKANYLKALEERVGPGIVGDIRFQVRDLTGHSQAAAAQEDDYCEVDLDAAETEEIRRQADSLPDDELRRAFLQASISARKLRKGRRQSGWSTCSRCGTLFPPGGGCPACLARESEKRRSMARLFLCQHPWWTRDEVSHEIPGLSDGDFRQVKREILAQWDLELQVLAREARSERGEGAQKNLRMAVMRYIMLALGRVPEELDPVTVERVLGKRVAAAMLQK